MARHHLVITAIIYPTNDYFQSQDFDLPNAIKNLKTANATQLVIGTGGKSYVNDNQIESATFTLSETQLHITFYGGLSTDTPMFFVKKYDIS